MKYKYAQQTQEPTGWVNDYAGVISNEYQEKLTSLIKEVETKTSAEIFVVTLQSIAPFDEKQYTRSLFDKWSPGKKGKDNGVLLLLAIKERRWRIETGYGIEAILPDGLCGQIGRNYMVPYFKNGKYSEGLYQGALKISQIITRDANVNLIALEGFKDKLLYLIIFSIKEHLAAEITQGLIMAAILGGVVGAVVDLSVKGYASHEKTLFEDVTNARSQLSRLLLVVENYPNLKADQTFLALMDELAGTENRIAVERMRYNESVRDYNVTVRMFPGNIVAGMFGYKTATEYFKAEEKAKTVPEVKF